MLRKTAQNIVLFCTDLAKSVQKFCAVLRKNSAKQCILRTFAEQCTSLLEGLLFDTDKIFVDWVWAEFARDLRIKTVAERDICVKWTFA